MKYLENIQKNDSTNIQRPIATNQNEEYHDIGQQKNEICSNKPLVIPNQFGRAEIE